MFVYAFLNMWHALPFENVLDLVRSSKEGPEKLQVQLKVCILEDVQELLNCSYCWKFQN